jgi:micrococcal nuclease
VKWLITIFIIISSTGSCTTYNVPKLKVDQVIDGDTIQVGEERIRLLGIDTPEVGPHKTEQCYGLEAKVFLNGLVGGKEVLLKKDSLAGERDPYGRLLAWVYLEGNLVNEEILLRGYGVAYRNRNEKKGRMLWAEKIAREKKVGIWKHCRVDCSGKYCQIRN